MIIFSRSDKASLNDTATFKTHLNYVKCIANHANSLNISINPRINSPLDGQKTAKFERLAKITKTSIAGEKTACDNEHAYAQVAAPWIPVKCYYRLYYLEAVFLYVLSGDESGFGNGGHKAVRKNLMLAVESGSISFSSAELATITTWQAANAFTTVSGATVRTNYFSDANCPNSLRKKLAEYIEHDWKQIKKIKDYRSRTSRNAKNRELLPKKFILADFFYWMRIKANYRDVDFLDFDNISEDDAYEYLTKFIEATESYGAALENAIVQLKTMRGIK